MHSSGISAEVRFGFFLYLFCVCSLIDGANKLHFTQNKLCFFLHFYICPFVPHIFVYILNDFLYMYSLIPFPLFTQIYANYVRLGVQRVSLKCQLFIEGTCAVCVLFFLRNYPKKNPKKQTKIKKQLRAHATFTKASNTPKNKVNKREKV